MTRKPKSSIPWLAFKIAGAKQKELGIIYADTEAEAVAEAVKEYGVPRNRVVVKKWNT